MKPTIRIIKNVQKLVKNKTNDEIPPINEHIGDKKHKCIDDDAKNNCNNNVRAKENKKCKSYPTHEMIDRIEKVLEAMFVFIISLRLKLAGGNVWDFLEIYAFIILVKVIILSLKVALMKMSKNKIIGFYVQISYIFYIILTTCVVIYIPLQNIPGFQYLLSRIKI